MKKSDIVITGMGVTTSIGYSVSHLMNNVYKGQNSYIPHKQLEESASIKHRVAYVNDEELIHDIDMRKARKLDRFSLLAMQAFRQSYCHSGLSELFSQNFGILLGNSTGGWSYVEPQLDDICVGNYNDLSPYVATAWFPTAPQGEISIHYKIAGYSKTFSADSLSFGYALDHAIYLMRNDYLPGAFVGAVESPLSPLVYNACVHAHKVFLSGNYIPFSKHSDGYLLGEGAGILTFEKYETAKERSQLILAKVKAVGFGSSLSNAIENSLKDSNLTSLEIDCIFMDAKGCCESDERELEELEKVFSTNEKVLLTTTKPLYGHLLDADFAVELIIAVQSLIDQKVPTGLFSKNNPRHFSFGKLAIDEALSASLQNVLIYACNASGAAICVILEKSESV